VNDVVREPARTVEKAPGGVVNGLEDGVNQVVGKTDETLQGVTGGKAPRLPKVDLQAPKSTLEPVVGETGSLLGTGQVLDDATGNLPLAPEAELPRTGVTMPGTGLTIP